MFEQTFKNIDNLAAAQGNRKAQETRDIVVKRMTPDQIAEAERMAREWMAKHQW